MDDTRGLECFWSDPSVHPQCPHGPMLLFGRYVDGNLEQFYACSACRDRKLCKFYLKHGEKLTKQQKIKWEQDKKKLTVPYPHQKLFIRFNEVIAKEPEARSYCHTCERLMLTSEKNRHNDHEVINGLTDDQMYHPTEILKPLNDAKKEAQYLFSKKSTEDIANMLVKLKAKQVLCIGTPRIHEYISQNLEDRMSSILLDLDGRFHNFFGPLSYCWYNLFNHHFFSEEAKEVFKDFITQNKGRDTYLICDPPFGGRVEAMSWTIKRISDLHRKWNNVEDDEDSLKIMFILPYFMEPTIKQKSNPPGVSGGLKDLKMSDYKVDYDNHPLFVLEKNGKKQETPVRIFTNVPLNLLELPKADGYKHCKRCQKWVSSENKHCKKCKSCTSKNGKRYRHCNSCARCVKATWKHCNVCKRCALPTHKCGQKPKTTGRCFKCNEIGHVENECNTSNTKNDNTVKTKKAAKRKLANEKEDCNDNGADQHSAIQVKNKKRKVNHDDTVAKKRSLIKVDDSKKSKKQTKKKSVVLSENNSGRKVVNKKKTKKNADSSRVLLKTSKKSKPSSKLAKKTQSNALLNKNKIKKKKLQK